MDKSNRLSDKVAVIYGNGAIGSEIAITFALHGAAVYLAGRTEEKLQQIRKKAMSQAVNINTKLVDALDEKSVETHLNEIIKEKERIDISFNTIGLSQMGIQGKPLTEISPDNFLMPVSVYLRSHFITTKAALIHMIKNNNGVILMHVPNASRISPPFVGGMVPDWSALEGLCRSISTENGQHNVRSVCLLTTGIPETPLIDEVWEIHGKVHGMAFEEFHASMESGTHRNQLTTLKELSYGAVFAASDESTSLSGTTLNLTAGMII